MRKLTWVSPGEKCVALVHKEHVKETCVFIITPHRSQHDGLLGYKKGNHQWKSSMSAAVA